MLLLGNMVQAKPTDLYLFYNSGSNNISEINITADELAKVFDDLFGPASDELPQEVKYADFYVSKFADGAYVFILKAPFNCGQLGCNTKTYYRDHEGDLIPEGGLFPVKCVEHGIDKLICTKGGYKPELKQDPKPKKRGPVHYPAPVTE